MKILFPPQTLIWDKDTPSIFLAGTIEMGNSIDWQSYIGNELQNTNIIILNPRRKDWDSSWEQSIDNVQFKQQVDWELDALEKAEHIFFHFEPDSKSPITMMELGLFAAGGKCLVHCPKGFWRKGNIDIVCQRHAIPQVNSLQEGIERIKQLAHRG